MNLEQHNDKVLGPKLAWTPRQPPARSALPGRYVRLEPIDPARHAHDLFELSHGPKGDVEIWNFLGYGPFTDEAAFSSWAAERAASKDPLFYAVIDLSTGRASGMMSYLRIAPADGAIEIGHIWFTPVIQRSRQATEAVFLLAKHAFDDLGYRRLEWKCNAANAASRRAALRFGFTFEGLFRQHMIIKGRNRDTAWYAILDRDWPAIRDAFERWLDPSNFAADGRQRQPLAARESAGKQPF